jgi:(p)ppGpp synthase/HD superfamily hydrolase
MNDRALAGSSSSYLGSKFTMANLDEALVLVSTNFRGVKDKSGTPYVLHCIRVMMSVESLDAKMVAVMHDLVEDTPMTLAQLKEKGFSETVLNGVDLVTHRSDVTYEDYIVQIKSNPLAREVKLADLKDNTSLGEQRPRSTSISKISAELPVPHQCNRRSELPSANGGLVSTAN